MKKYEEINGLEIDVMREIGSIGTGNAATALSEMMNRKIKMTMPEVQILGFNEAITKLGDPEMISKYIRRIEWCYVVFAEFRFD